MFARLTYAENPLFGELRRLEQEVDELFSGSIPWSGGIRSQPLGTFPAINVGSTGDSVTVYLFAPGIDPQKLDISIQQNVLSVSGQRELSADPHGTSYRRERFGGAFHRVVTLPEDVDPDKVGARYREGIVEISVGRRESAKPRQIEIP